MSRIESFTLSEIIAIADKGYASDGLVLAYFNEPDVDHGDTLAKFVVLELKDTFSPEDRPETQLDTAKDAMLSARKQMDGVTDAFYQEWAKLG